MPAEEALGASGEKDTGFGCVDGGTGGLEAIERDGQIVESDAIGVFDREAGYSRLDAAADALGDVVGCCTVAILEIGVDGEVGGTRDFGDVSDDGIAADGIGVIGEAAGEGKSGAG